MLGCCCDEDAEAPLESLGCCVLPEPPEPLFGSLDPEPPAVPLLPGLIVTVEPSCWGAGVGAGTGAVASGCCCCCDDGVVVGCGCVVVCATVGACADDCVAVAGFLYVAMSDLIPDLHRATADAGAIRQVLLVAAGVATVLAF